MKSYDLILIGSGAANIVADAALEAGKRIALVEKDRWGGTCLNRGCLPTKVLTTAADLTLEVKRLEGLGILDGTAMHWDALGRRAWEKIGEHEDVSDYYLEEGADLYHGTASCLSNHELKVTPADPDGDEVTIRGDIIVIGNGARTTIPPIAGIEDVPYMTSERFFASPEAWLDSLPEHIAILGGGTIGTEFAHIFAAAGARVTILQRNVKLVPSMDETLSRGLQAGFKARGIDVRLAADVTDVAYREHDGFTIHYRQRASHRQETVKADMFFLAPGVTSNADTLALEHTEIETDGSGYIRSNEFCETTAAGVYALGDINGRYQFRHMANYEAEVLAWNLYQRGDRPPRWVLQDAVPQVTYTGPQLASVGLTEEEARAVYAPDELLIAHSSYAWTGKGFALGYGEADQAEVKLITTREDRRILGVHILGYEASSLIQPFIYLINARPRALHPVEPDIETAFSARYRQGSPTFAPEVWRTAFMDQSMTPHPALPEVATWATAYLKPADEPGA